MIIIFMQYTYNEKYSSNLDEEAASTIPLSTLYQTAGVWEGNFVPSFDGSIIASFLQDESRRTIRLRRSSDAHPYEEIDASEINDFYWHPFVNALLVNRNGRLWQIPAETQGQEDWVDITPRGFMNADILRWPKAISGRLIVSSTDRNPAFPDLYTVRTDGSDKKLLEENDGYTLGWWFNADLIPIVRLDTLPNGNKRVVYRKPGDKRWTPVLDIDRRDDFEILRSQIVKADLYALSNRERNTVALVRVDLETGIERVVAQKDEADILSVMFLNETENTPDLVAYIKNGFPDIEALTSAGERFRAMVKKRHRPTSGGILGQSSDGRFVTTAERNGSGPSSFFLLDLERGTKERLGSTPLSKWVEDLSQMTPETIPARDGLKLPVLLTLPINRPPENLPSVVMVHGGPAVSFTFGFDPDVQMLANRGYAVLQVNFRGSTDFGKAFRAAGYGEAGKAMQDDIVDAARWLIEKGIADPARMVVMGASFGGYSAALAMTRDPGLFKAAIVESGVLDLRYQMQNNPYSWALSRGELERYFGNPDDADDLEEMWRRSPLSQANRAQGAFLLMAGKKDTVVGFEQTEAFARALTDAGNSVQTLYHENEGHGVTSPEALNTRAQAIEKFLAEQLGEPPEELELPARFLDWLRTLSSQIWFRDARANADL